tara:strand:- start:92 stop:427 length:336 start_codon:yes stop_codon:yes gene_type:complete
MFKMSRRFILMGIFLLIKAVLFLLIEYSYLIKKYKKDIVVKNKYKSSGIIRDTYIIMDKEGHEYDIDDKFFSDKDKKKLWRELSEGEKIIIEYHGISLPFLNNHLKIINIS